jgi:hypothetical protein
METGNAEVDLAVQILTSHLLIEYKMKVAKCFIYVYFSDGATSSSNIGHQCLFYSSRWYGLTTFILSRHNEVVNVNFFV